MAESRGLPGHCPISSQIIHQLSLSSFYILSLFDFFHLLSCPSSPLAFFTSSPASLSLISYCCSVVLLAATTSESHMLSSVAQHPQLVRSRPNGAPGCPFQLTNFDQLLRDPSYRRPPLRDHVLWSTTPAMG